MTARKKKSPVSVYLDPEIMTMLAEFAARRGQSRSMFVEASIASFLSPDADERREAAVVKRLDQIDRRVSRLERDVGISVETLAVFVRFWLTTTPPLPDTGQAAAKASGNERYKAFIEALGRRVETGSGLARELSEDRNGVGESPFAD